MKKVIVTLLAACMLTAGLAACGEEKDATAPTAAATEAATANIAETTRVTATTAAGGTVEEDSEGNVIERDETGAILSVQDKNGNPVEVSAYVSAHPAANALQPTVPARQDETSRGSAAEKPQPTVQTATAPPVDSEEEGEIPQIIVDVPDEDEYELPII